MTNRLDAQPTATAYELGDLVQQAWRGHIRIPYFQRGLKWGQKEVLDLFDSILKGYPIGSLLFWLQDRSTERVQLGALTIDAPEQSNTLLVVDGQQRLASMASALHPAGRTDQRFSISFDLDAGRFIATTEQDNPSLVPLYVIFDLQRLIRWFADHREIQDRLDDASRIASLIRQYKIPAYLVEPNDESALREIFDRLNNSGKKLTKAEVFNALHYGHQDSSDEVISFSLIAQRVADEREFGLIDENTIMRALLARRGPSVERDIRIEFDEKERNGAIDFPSEDREAAFRATEEAIIRAVTFLQNDAGVPHVSFLAYRYLLVVLVRVFAHYPNLDQRNIQLLRRWFWRAALAGPSLFKGGNTGTTRALTSRIHTNDFAQTIDNLMEPLTNNQLSLNLAKFKTSTADTKIMLSSWWNLRPRSFETGEEYNLTQLSATIEDKQTAADAVVNIVDRRSVPNRLKSASANRILLPDPEHQSTEVEESLVQHRLGVDGPTWEKILHSHSITPEMIKYLPTGQIEIFFDERDKLLAENLSVFLRAMCEWEFEDTPSLSDLVFDEEASDDEVSDADPGK